MTPAPELWSWLTTTDRRDAALAGLAMGTLGLWTGTPLALAVLGATALAILRIDGRRHLIPDLLTLPLALAGLGRLAWTGPQALPGSLLTAALVLAALEVFRRLAARALGRPALGGGDVKLIASAALWLPATQVPTYLLLAASSGLVEALVFRRRRLAFGRHLSAWLCLMVVAGPGIAI